MASGNVYDKFGSKNPIVRLLMHGFLNALYDSISDLPIRTIAEVGCGEGEIGERLVRIFPGVQYSGFDISQEIIEEARRRHPDLHFTVLPIEQLQGSSVEADLVVASEVFEHLTDPIIWMESILHVPFRYLLLSVPREPVWRILNVARGKYLKRYGNTPGHVNHWSKGSFLKFLSLHSDTLKIVSIRSPFPWTMVLCTKR